VASDPSPTLPATSAGPSSAPPSSGRAPLSTDPRPPSAALDFALLRGAIEEIPVGVATMREGAIVYANDALTRIFGAPAGGLERRQLSQLFPDETYARIAEQLGGTRAFDGRVRARGFDGRLIDAEVHIEQYSSEAQGMGGFLVVRDISFEASALGRLVDQLGAALFRIRVADGVLEHVSPAIAKVIGIDAGTCTQHPVLLTELCSAEERERVAFLYRRVARGEIPVANAQVSLKRHDGTTRLLQIRATARRDTSGHVSHIDGVISDAARDAASSDAPPGAAPRQRQDARARDPIAGATMELSHELLREASQHLHALGRELRGLRSALRGRADTIPQEAADELALRIESASSALSAAAVLNRGVRRVLTGHAAMGAPFAEVLQNVQASLAPLVGVQHAAEGVGAALVVDAGDTANVILSERVDELCTALTYLSLRAFRFAGSGSLRIAAHRVVPPPESQRPRSRLSRPPAEREQLVIEILGTAPADMVDTVVDISSDMLHTIPRPAEADLAYQAAQMLVASAGGTIESDDTTFSTARSVVRLRL
jgi:PAS domain S-box-containing protein